MKRIAANGDQAVALTWKQVNPDVCASYPITPQTIIVEAFSDYVADGEVDTEYVCSESEHSSMALVHIYTEGDILDVQAKIKAMDNVLAIFDVTGECDSIAWVACPSAGVWKVPKILHTAPMRLARRKNADKRGCSHTYRFIYR